VAFADGHRDDLPKKAKALDGLVDVAPGLNMTVEMSGPLHAGQLTVAQGVKLRTAIGIVLVLDRSPTPTSPLRLLGPRKTERIEDDTENETSRNPRLSEFTPLLITPNFMQACFFH
jgi:hypothetical protein